MNTLRQTFAAILNGLKDKKTTNFNDKTSATLLCNEIQETAKGLNFCFTPLDGTMSCFIGTHWEKIPTSMLRCFLGMARGRLIDDSIEGRENGFLSKLEKQFPDTTRELDCDQAKNKINFPNGTLDLNTGNLGPHNRKDFFRNVLPFDYDPNAKCDLFHKYLDRVMPDKAAQDVLAEYVGWIFAPEIKLEKILFLYGQGCNGKSVFVDIIEALMGRDNVSNESISDMCNGERGANHRANIVGKLVNICADVAANAFGGDLFKRMASGEYISAKILYSDVITTKNYAKMIFCLNELPQTKDTSKGYYRRFLIAPFNVQIPKHEIDPKLAQKIISAELPGIMNWVLEGRERLVRQNGFSECKLFEEANEKYRNKDKKSLIWFPPFK